MKAGTTNLIKFKKLHRRLGFRTNRETVGLLETLWQLVARDAPRGDIGKFDNESIAIGLEWEEDPDQLVEWLVETQWLDACDEHRLIVHDWHEHAPNYVRGVASKKGGIIQSPTLVPDYESPTMSPGLNEAESTTSSPSPPSLAYSSLAKPSLDTASAVCSEPASLDSKPPAPPVELSEFVFPVTGKDAPKSKTWTLTAAKLREYEAAYDTLDVRQEMIRAREWCIANTARRKTPGGMLAFLTGWLNREVNNPRAGPQQGPRPKVTSGRFEGNADSEF